jgi:hypothetical protein
VCCHACFAVDVQRKACDDVCVEGRVVQRSSYGASCLAIVSIFVLTCTCACTHGGHRFVVTVSEDTTARVWDMQALSSHTPSLHEGRIHCLAAWDGHVVATAGECVW